MNCLCCSENSQVQLSSWCSWEWICHFCLDSRIWDPTFFPVANGIVFLILDLLIFMVKLSPSWGLTHVDAACIKKHRWCRLDEVKKSRCKTCNICVFLYKSVPLLVSNKLYLFSSCYQLFWRFVAGVCAAFSAEFLQNCMCTWNSNVLLLEHV